MAWPIWSDCGAGAAAAAAGAGCGNGSDIALGAVLWRAALAVAAGGGGFGGKTVHRRVEHGLVRPGFDKPGKGGKGIGLCAFATWLRS